jgi:hypothetical protein
MKTGLYFPSSHMDETTFCSLPLPFVSFPQFLFLDVPGQLIHISWFGKHHSPPPFPWVKNFLSWLSRELLPHQGISRKTVFRFNHIKPHSSYHFIKVNWFYFPSSLFSKAGWWPLGGRHASRWSSLLALAGSRSESVQPCLAERKLIAGRGTDFQGHSYTLKKRV